MTTYQINLTGIHCEGCTRLIKLSLEDANFKVTHVDLYNRQLQFQTIEVQSELELNNALTKVFADLPGYGYSNLIAQ